jgi:hypothetical protein
MRAVVVYESMFGNTHAIAEAIGEGLRDRGADVDVLPVRDADGKGPIDLLVVGGPTHAWNMSRPTSRKSAADTAAKNSELTLEPGATGPGLREWLPSMGYLPTRAAAFDTRRKLGIISGSAARPIAGRLRASRIRPAARPRGFYVSDKNRLLDGELARARRWGTELAESVMRAGPPAARPV